MLYVLCCGLHAVWRVLRWNKYNNYKVLCIIIIIFHYGAHDTYITMRYGTCIHGDPCAHGSQRASAQWYSSLLQVGASRLRIPASVTMHVTCKRRCPCACMRVMPPDTLSSNGSWSDVTDKQRSLSAHSTPTTECRQAAKGSYGRGSVRPADATTRCGQIKRRNACGRSVRRREVVQRCITWLAYVAESSGGGV